MPSGKKKIKENNELLLILVIASTLILGLSAYTDSIGILSSLVQNNIYKILGILIYILPVYIFYYKIEKILSKKSIQATRRLIGVTILIVTVYVFCATFYMHINSRYTLGELLNFIKKLDNSVIHCGVAGTYLAYPIKNILGYIGAYIVYLVSALIGLSFILNITIKEVISYIEFIKKNHKQSKARGKKPARKEYSNFATLAKKRIANIIVDKPTNINESPVEKKDDIIKDNTAEELIENDNEEIEDQSDDYVYPTVDLLKKTENKNNNSNSELELKNRTTVLEKTLEDFGVKAKVIKTIKGPTVSRFELQLDAGVKVSKIVNLQDDIALALAANGIRIEAPIPGKAAVGIEIPNLQQESVTLREVIDSESFNQGKQTISFAIGKDINGDAIVGDITKMPHMLVAGATGSGKSVCINSLIISILYKYSPKEVKLLMIDPKVVELSVYNGIPHLLAPVVTDPNKASKALLSAVKEMNFRYAAFFKNKVKNIESYNKLIKDNIIQEKLPHIVVIIDELADLMMACSKEVEDYICRLTQMARAAGIHLVIATQRPSTDVITGLIKANIPSRISFAVSSGIDSRTILDSVGAEKLLGKGDMLYYPAGENKPMRVQGAFVSEEEVENIVNHIKIKNNLTTEKYAENVIDTINSISNKDTSTINNTGEDPLLVEATKIAIESKTISVSYIQRRLKIGFNRASRIVDALEEKKVISKKDGSKPREVLIKNLEEINHNNG